MKTATIDVSALKAALNAVSTEETRYYLNGVLLEIDARETRYVATDGHILFAHRAELPNYGPVKGEPIGTVNGSAPDNTLTGHFIIPSATIKAIKLAKRDSTGATLEAGEGRRLTLKLDNGLSFGFEPIDGCFPAWRRVLPVKTSGKTAHGYNPNLLLKLWKAGEALGIGQPSLSYNDDAPALLVYPGAAGQTLAVIMPMRQGKGEAELPNWARDGAGESVSELEPVKAAA